MNISLGFGDPNHLVPIIGLTLEKDKRVQMGKNDPWPLRVMLETLSQTH